MREIRPALTDIFCACRTSYITVTIIVSLLLVNVFNFYEWNAFPLSITAYNILHHAIIFVNKAFVPDMPDLSSTPDIRASAPLVPSIMSSQTSYPLIIELLRKFVYKTKKNASAAFHMMFIEITHFFIVDVLAKSQLTILSGIPELMHHNPCCIVLYTFTILQNLIYNTRD